MEYNIDLDNDEIVKREKEFSSFGKKERDLLFAIQGKQNTRCVSFISLINNSIQMIQETEDDDLGISTTFLEFISWVLSHRLNEIGYNKKYEKNIEIFEDIINNELEDEDEFNILKYANAETKRLFFKSSGENLPLSGLENEVGKRMEILFSTEADLINIFDNIENYKDLTWDEFRDML